MNTSAIAKQAFKMQPEIKVQPDDLIAVERRFYSPEQTLEQLQGYGNPGIYRCLEMIRPVAQGTDMLQVLDVFRDHQQEHFFPVLDPDGRPVGLVCERSLKSYVYSRFGLALLANRSQAKVLENFLSPCPSVEIDAPTEQVLQAAHEIAGSEGVIVTSAGCYVGFVRASSLVELAHDQQMETARQHNAALDFKNREIQAVLQNMRQGICTVLPDMTLHPDYSAHLATILECDALGGKSVMEVLFTHAETGADELQQIAAALMAVLDQDELMYDCNAHLLPGELEVVLSGQHKILELHWSPVSDAEGMVTRLMLVVRDVSQMRQLQQQAAAQQRELQWLGEILAAGERRFLQFMQDSQADLVDCQQLLARWRNGPCEESVDLSGALYRYLHTIKGNARTLGLNSVTDSLHDAEQVLQTARESGSVLDGQLIRAALHKVDTDLTLYSDLYKSKLQGFGSSDTSSSSKIANLGQLLSEAIEGMPALAAELGKCCPQALLSGDMDSIRVRKEHHSRLKSVMTHILRNSLDHGIETAAERDEAGKPALSAFSVHAIWQDDSATLIVADDGRGLALTKIRDKARLSGLCSDTGKHPDHMTDDEIADLIFYTGLSTAENVSMISGRGVGMDAVRYLLAEAGADISVHWQSPDHDNTSHRPFQLHIKLPASMLL